MQTSLFQPADWHSAKMISSKKMKILNLYAGLGGNRLLWENVQVTAVENDEKIANAYAETFPNDRLVIGDAKDFLLKHSDDYDVIWAPPPCQSHSRMTYAQKSRNKFFIDMSLYQIIVFLTNYFPGRWIVENVQPYYTPLIKPTLVTGRHYIWASHYPGPVPKIKNFHDMFKNDTIANHLKMKSYFGFNYHGIAYNHKSHSPTKSLRNCVHPVTGYWLLKNLMQYESGAITVKQPHMTGRINIERNSKTNATDMPNE